MVLVSYRRPEQSHDPVTAILVDGTFEAMDAVSEDAEEPIHDAVPILGIDRLREIHRALHVGEEDGDLLTLSFESAARREDLFDEVLRGVRPRVGRLLAVRHVADAIAAGVTELSPLRIRAN